MAEVAEAQTDSAPVIQPLPWTARASEHDHQLWSVYDANDVRVFAFVTEDEARLIVKAVNHHEALVGALKAVRADRSAYQWHGPIDALLAKVQG